jgi:hypothetical protein
VDRDVAAGHVVADHGPCDVVKLNIVAVAEHQDIIALLQEHVS